jgi:hypothetical protein
MRPFANRLGVLLLSLMVPATTFAETADKLTIRNESLAVTVDPAISEFSIAALPGGRTVVSAGKLATLTGKIAKHDVTDKVFGTGQAIAISDATGASGEVALYPGLPFAMVRLTLKNAGADAEVLNRVPVASFDANPGTALQVRGTGGLALPDKAPGSYEWLAVADEKTRNGIVAGFVTHDRATGVLIPSPDSGAVKIQARSEYGRLRIVPSDSAQTETLAIGYFDDARLGLEAWADAIARQYKIALPPQPTGYCTWYSDKHGGAGDEKSIAELSDFAKKHLEPFGFNFIQIDDGWQQGEKLNGPRKNFTDFRLNGPYPAGMKATADRLKADGLMPGIWFMPFAGTYNDPWFKDHADWFAKHDDGKPYDTAWGGTCMDMTNPAARDYVRSVVRKIAGDWGYTYFKMDGMWTGLAAKQIYVNAAYKEDNFGDAVLSNPDKTNIEAIRDGLKLVRKAAGPKVFFLGCNIAQNMRAYGGTFGLLDAMRIGPDNKGTWEGWAHASPLFGSRHYFLHGRVWYNDPDPNYLREKLTLDEARTIATWTAISGQLNTNSDWVPGLPADRLDLLKRTMPAHGRTARPVDFFENDPPRIWQVSDDKSPVRRDVIALYNWDAAEAAVNVPLSRFNLSEATQYAAFDYWADAFLPPIAGSIKATLPAHGCLDLAVRPMLDRPFLLSTSRHITQGMVDVIDEQWDATTKSLNGKSRVVGGDPYQLRIVTPGNWKASSAAVSGDDNAAGVETKVAQDGSGVRMTVNSQTSRTIVWSVVFGK